MGISILAVFTGALLVILFFALLFATWQPAVLILAALGGILILYGVLRFKKIKGASKMLNGKKYGKKKYTLNGICLSGLPCGEANCKVIIYKNAISFNAGRHNYDLEMNRIISVMEKTHSEVVGAKTGSAVAGAALFGVLGAIVASRPKNKTEYIMLINYVGKRANSTETIGLAFDKDQKSYVSMATQFINSRITTGSHTTL